MLICPFEDDRVANLRPIVDTRPVYDLRVGIHTVFELITRQIPHTGVVLHTRTYLAGIANQDFRLPVNRFVPGTGVLFVNGRYQPEPGPLLERIRSIGDNTPGLLLVQDDQVVVAWMPSVPEGFALRGTVTAEDFDGLPVEAAEGALLLDSLPGLIHGATDALLRGFALETRGIRQIERPGTFIDPGAIIAEPDQIFMAPGARIRAGAIVDASEGPIYLDENSVVMPGAVVRGPSFVGAGSRINGAANLESAAIGPGCKIGGEVHTGIFHSNSNKAHEGFMGHSYVGQWCNFGADSNTSNLRNDYGSVSYYHYPTGRFVDSGHQFLGLIFADHAKCSITTMFNTGTVVGVGSNLYGCGFHDRFIPAFAWGEPGRYVPYRLDKFLDVAAAVMPRRNLTLTDVDREMLAYLHAQTMRMQEVA